MPNSFQSRLPALPSRLGVVRAEGRCGDAGLLSSGAGDYVLLLASGAEGAMTQEMKWTPGPWRVELFMGLPVVSSSSRRVADTHIQEGIGALRHGKGEALRSEIAANARLIAAAPDLYSALKAMHDHFGVLEDNPMLHRTVVSASKAARAALAKARGESEPEATA